MTERLGPYAVYSEAGKKRTFVASVEWPGWARSGRDEASALQTLLDYGSRYARVLGDTGLGFIAPKDVATLDVLERLQGNATTDFGAPGIIPSSDYEPPETAERERWPVILTACWQALDAAAAAATGKELRKGPRGGGRDLQEIVDHVLDAEMAYLGNVGLKWYRGDRSDPLEEAHRRHQQVLHTLAAAQGAAPSPGPRGGKRWPWRYFVRRAAWHILDHAWEIEDRAV